jgi:hypothetical protein
MDDRSYHNEGRAPTMQDVNAILSKIREGSKKNPPISGLRLRRIMIEKAGGFPKALYHASLEPVYVLNEDQEEELKAIGYQEQYIPRTHPKTLYRRNSTNPRFAQIKDPSTGIEGYAAIGAPRPGHMIEERIVKSAEEEEALKKEKPARHCGVWRDTPDEVDLHDPLPDLETQQDLELENARLRGQVEAMQTAGAAGKRPRD